MLSFKGTFANITSYRLGYTSQRPYPWRWATPAVLGVFFLISVFLAFLNVPLSAYDTVQESTYRPNDTLPPLLFSKLVPGLLQSSQDTFVPHVLTIGENVVVNNSIFNFTIIHAWDENSVPVSSFSYYNNRFSDGCDISNMTFTTSLEQALPSGLDTLSVDVMCLTPTRFWMTSSIQSDSLVGNPLREILAYMWSDLDFALFADASPIWNVSEVSASVIPCCGCNGTIPSGTSLPSDLPCQARPARLVGSYWSIGDYSSGFHSGGFFNSTVIFEAGMDQTELEEPPQDDQEFYTQPGINGAFQNVFQSLYHLARLELGIIVENQIFNSPLMFNKTISTLYPPGSLSIENRFLAANESRASTSNTTLMKEWADVVHLFNTTDIVPVINYLRPVPRLKPLGSALTSVFVSTFAMVSVLWTVFSLVAGVIAARAETSEGAYILSTMEERITTNSVAIDTHGIAMAQMEVSFARMQLALKKRGLFEEDNEEGNPEASITCTGGEEEESTLLVHHKQLDSYSAV